MKKLFYTICDGCRLIITEPRSAIRIKGKKRELHYCDTSCAKTYNMELRRSISSFLDK